MILVPLIDLVQVSGTEHLWPEEFRQLVQSYEEIRNTKPRPVDDDSNEDRPTLGTDDRSMFPAITDWLIDHNEGMYAEAWKWLLKRPEVKICHTADPYDRTKRRWSFNDAPFALEINGVYRKSFPDLVAMLATKIESVKRQIEVI